ncbi:MAG: class I SAM-dependent methyltransferase [Syntrophobacteraceae bacterium]
MTEEHDPGSEFALQIVEIRRFDEVGARFHKIATLWEVERKYRFKRSWLGKTKSFKVRGYCPVCGYTDLTVHDTWAQANPDGSKTPCWREQAWCGCGMNTRMRSALDWIIHCERPAAEALIYCTEATTPFFRGLVRLHPLTLGSEYIPSRAPLGSVDSAGLRCESLERLSFPDKVFELLASLDVLEHVFSYHDALAEMYRVLKPGGAAIITVPFLFEQPQTVQRALIDGGQVVHLVPPIYHGDPLTSAGALLVYDYGWDLVETMREIGWTDIKFLYVLSEQKKYFGTNYFLRALRPV